MSSNFLLASFVSHIKNGYLISKKNVVTPFSNLLESVCKILQSEGFIESYEVFEESKGIKKIKVFLRYVNAKSSIREIKLISKPGKRVYGGYRNIKPYIDGLGFKIVSTSKGVVTDHDARTRKIGGEVLLNIF